MKAFLGAIALATAGCAAHSTPSQPTEVSTEQLAAQIDGLEAASGGRLGLALFSQDEGLVFAHRGAERFAMCS
ncbi:MAG: class A beta-lactamase, partial [Pseudomonadota bacterium]|nr:class A beta-lactamase [Pseudomonadota bacterium]